MKCGMAESTRTEKRRPRKRRPRRSSAEVRHLILEAARELFATKGYGGATTMAIAERADVSEAVLFRNFSSKEALFEAAVLEPVEEFVRRYTALWSGVRLPAGAPEEVMRQYTEALFDIVSENRHLFAALVSNRLGAARLREAFARLDEMGDEMAAAHGLVYDTPVSVRSAFVMVVGVTLLEHELFPDKVNRRRMVDELTRMLTGALLYRPEG
jgi:AcrR family transcriptional regulator